MAWPMRPALPMMPMFGHGVSFAETVLPRHGAE
jgi:hypothetical protein